MRDMSNNEKHGDAWDGLSGCLKPKIEKLQPYLKPRLVEYGSVRALTGTGTTAAPDSTSQHSVFR